MLIATLPEVHREELMERIISHPLIGGVRYNVGYTTPYPPKEALERILKLVEIYDKKFWLDLKGRQLRIVHWAVPNYGTIMINHEIEVDCPAKVYFRGNESSELKVVKGNHLYVDPPPPKAVGQGQAINIHGDNLIIKEYLTEEDRVYIEEACKLGVTNFMLSFVEESQDLEDVKNIIQKNAVSLDLCEFVLKIESLKGLDFINNFSWDNSIKCNLMAARDDLMINIGENKAQMIEALKNIVCVDPNSILASRLFHGIETCGDVVMGDWSDLYLMKNFGYKNFMFSDGICGRHFEKAMKAWSDYHKIY